MAYRVYDTEQKCWVNDVYLSTNGELYKEIRSFFGIVKLVPLNSERYVYHNDINLYDKNEALIFEGDVVNAQVGEDKFVTGFVAYVNELAGYAILCDDTEEFYMLGSDVCEFIEIVGNVFDNKNE